MFRAFTLAIVLCGLVVSQANADFMFVVESATFNSNGITPTSGSVNVFLTSNNPAVDFPGGVGPNIQSYVANLQVANLSGITAVTYLPATQTTAPFTPLFANVPNSTLPPVNPPGQISVSTSFADLGSNPASFNNAGLFKLNFTTPIGQGGTFDFVFLDTPGFPTDLYNTAFADILTSGIQGTITITAVPEPSSLALLGVAGLVCGWRRSRKVKTASL